MQKHTKIYLNYFGFHIPSDVICEICTSPAVDKTSTLHAAKMIYFASSPIRVNDPRFFETNERAMADMVRCAEEEKKLPA